MYTFTPEQDAAIVHKWNEIADEAAQLRPGQAHLVVGDLFLSVLESFGEHFVTVDAHDAKPGIPPTFHIIVDEVTFDG